MRSSGRFYVLTALYAVLVGVFATHYFIRNSQYSIDDSFITYRYADNLRAGFGLVFNPGERHYGTTAVGYAVLLAGTATVVDAVGSVTGVESLQRVDLPVLSVAVSATALALIAMLFLVMARAGQDLRYVAIAAFASVYVLTANAFNKTAGHETNAFIAAAFLGVVAVLIWRRYVLGAAIIAVAASMRPDAALFALVVPLVDWIHSRRLLVRYVAQRRVIAFFVTCAGLLGLWLMFLTLQFGTPVPATMAAKQAQAALGYWPLYNLRTLLAFLAAETGVLSRLLIGVGLLLVVVLGVLRTARADTLDACSAVAWTWLAFALLSVPAYFTFQVTFWHWYGVPVLFALVVTAFTGWMVGTGATPPAEEEPRDRGRTSERLIVAALPVAAVAGLSLAAIPMLEWWLHSENINPHLSAYTDVVDYLRAEAPDGAVVQTSEPGWLAIASGRPTPSSMSSVSSRLVLPPRSQPETFALR